MTDIYKEQEQEQEQMQMQEQEQKQKPMQVLRLASLAQDDNFSGEWGLCEEEFVVG
jgi:hypothetical protein